MGEGDEDKKLASAVRAALALADRRGMKSIALPAISTGIFGFPIDRAARIMLTEIQRFLQGGTKLERVVLCLYDEEAFEVFKRELRRGFRVGHEIRAGARICSRARGSKPLPTRAKALELPSTGRTIQPSKLSPPA